MEDLSLHILDIVENSITAGASNIRIKINEDTKENLLLIEISDNGRGMDEEMLKNALDPFHTTRTTRNVGLGIPFLADAARDTGGDISIKSAKGEGTTISAAFRHDHIDRKPLGDIGKTLIVIIASNPDIDIIFEHKKNTSEYMLDTAEIKKELDGVPINAPGVIKVIENDLKEWFNNTNLMIK
ncbi:MAG: ATP-binding protein [Nitrospirae bacterium]|nr:ATP-binding protein [Nitrospirota bacterium]